MNGGYPSTAKINSTMVMQPGEEHWASWKCDGGPHTSSGVY